jgi:hypothetical protein
MEPYEENDMNENESSGARGGTNRALVVALIALLGIAGFGVTYGIHEKGQVQQLKDQATVSSNVMGQMQAQVNTLTAKLNDMTAAQNAAQKPKPSATEAEQPAASQAGPAEESPAATSGTGGTVKHIAPKRATTKRRAPTDKRYSQLKAQLDEQQKQLKETQEAVAKNRLDLEGNISSTRDELNGSIARTHEELVVLQKRGERSYTEFDLMKSKQFQRVGPITLSLRKADTKHKSYDLALVVDDNELNKKKVNLYEPVWIHTESGGQPIQVVVNRIDKNLVHGYVSAPKYKQSELANVSFSGTAPSATSSQQPAPQPQP